jgi:hypothetical protein
MGQRNKDCTLGYLCVEKAVGQKTRAPDTVGLSGAHGTGPMRLIC